MEEVLQTTCRPGVRMLSGAELRRHAEMLVRVSEEAGLPLDDSGLPGLDEAIVKVRCERSASVEG